jgi:NitT/TauT family transport system substrate-binding protein
MRRKFPIVSILFLVFMLVSTTLAGCGNKTSSTQSKNSTTKVRLNEVTRSVFYAPFYVAMNQGFFKAEGLDIDLTIGQGADKTMQEVMSGNADIGFCGPEQTIYINVQKRENYPILFAQLTQTDGSFLVSRKQEANFSWESLQGKTILGGRPGGVPEMALEYALKKHGLVNEKNITIITNVAFAAAPGAFKGGTGEYAALFEPSGSMLEKDKSGYIVASVGKEVGTMPYTCYFTTKSYLDKHSDVIEKFTRAIYKGQLWVDSHNDAEVAEQIKSFFPGTDVDILANVTKNYRAINAFAHDPILKEENLNILENVIEGYNKTLIPERPAFSKIVNTSIAEKVVKETKK